MKDHMAVTGCRLKSNSSRLRVPLCSLSPCCFFSPNRLHFCRSEAILLNLGYTLHSYCVPCQGKMGQEGMCCVGSFRSRRRGGRRKKSSSFQTKWHRLPEDRLTGLMQHITISWDVMNSEWHSAPPRKRASEANRAPRRGAISGLKPESL